MIHPADSPKQQPSAVIVNKPAKDTEVIKPEEPSKPEAEPVAKPAAKQPQATPAAVPAVEKKKEPVVDERSDLEKQIAAVSAVKRELSDAEKTSPKAILRQKALEKAAASDPKYHTREIVDRANAKTKADLDINGKW